MYEVGVKGDSGKYETRPLQQWFRDLLTPIFLKLFVNPKASDWMFFYRVNCEVPVETRASDLVESQKIASPISVAK